jgi:nicotinamidase-related amidase
MASIEKFNDHCWKDVIPEADLRLYSGWRRETFVGLRPALLAIDLYDLVYRGGPRPPIEINDQYPNTCGIYAHRAIEPTKQLFAAARGAGIPIFYCTQDTHPNNRPRGAVSTRNQRPRPGPDAFAIYREFTPQPSDIVIWKQRASAFSGTPLFSHLSLLGASSLIVCGESTSGCVRASVVDAYSNGFHVPGGGVHLRSRRADAQRSLRPAPQIRGCDASRRGRRASRCDADGPRRRVS